MLQENKKLARGIGALLLLQFIIGILINQVLLGPHTFAADYLHQVAIHPSAITMGMLLGLLNEIISIAIAVLLFPIFKTSKPGWAIAYLGFSFLNLAMVAIDNGNVQLLMAMGKAQEAAVQPATGYFQSLGPLAYSARLWSHLNIFINASISLGIFYYLLWVSKILPVFISVWGLLATLCMLAAALLEVFHMGSFMVLFLPLAINQVWLIVWLLFKGFGVKENISVQEI